MAENTSNSSTKTQSATPKLGFGAYVMALISAAFVTFGVILVVGFSHLFVGDWVESAPVWVSYCISLVAIGLGLLSGWQSLQKSKKKLVTTNQTRNP